MYAVSDAYKMAMKRSVQRFRMTGSVSNMPFTHENILKRSFTITNQCSDNTEIKIGQVYVGELNVTFINMNLPRYSLKDRPITPFFGLMLESGEYEDIPLGVFNISEAEWTASGVVIKAYDNMSKFDKGCTIKSVNGTPYQLALLACQACGVDLGTTEDEFATFANGTENLSMVTENDIETWRDFLSWVAQTCACFATCNREGSIVFRSYGKDVVDTIEPQHRFAGGSFSDYETRYTGLSCVNIAEKTTSYYGMEVDNALTYNLGSNPFLQLGVEKTKENLRRAILQGLANICYVPFKVQMIGNPAYDLGDVFCFTDGIADGNKLFCLTKYTFNYDGAYEIQGVGKDPAISNAKSKTDKNIAGLMNQEEDKLRFTVFTNTGAIEIADQQSKSILDMRFIVAKTTHVAIDMEILLSVETTETVSGEFEWTENDAVVEATYYLDGEELELRHPVETWQDGRHILHLRYDIQTIDAAIHTWGVWLTVNGGSINIEPYAIHSVIMGTGMAAEDKWDGTIDAYDDVLKLDFFSMLRGIQDNVDVVNREPAKKEIVDSVGKIDFFTMFRGIQDSIDATADIVIYSPWINSDKVDTECTYDSKVGWIGDGELSSGTALTVTTVPMHGVTKVESESTNVSFYASFDHGATWLGWTEEGWTETSMNKAEIEAVPESAWAQGGDSVQIRALLEKNASLSILNVYGGKIDA